MPGHDPSSRPGLEAWRVGDLRLTAFTDPFAPAETSAEGKRWEAMVGKPPENVISRLFGTDVEENGPFPSGGKLSYKRSPRGVEWMLESAPDPEMPETFFGMNTAVITPFSELIRRWLVDCPAFQRLAFGAALYLQVRDKAEGYRRLSDYLGLQLDPENTGDFLYQINRRRRSRSGVPNLEINRLSKWTWAPFGVRGPEGEQPWPVARHSVCLLELDINTAPEFRGPFPREAYVPLFDELVAFAEEIAVKGPVP
jgi:hypothetical protein